MFELLVNSRTKQLKKNEKGFTLVELIIVVAILGILAAVGISRFSGMTDNARINTDLSAAGTIASAAKAWRADQNSSVTGLPAADSAASLTLLQTEGYLESGVSLLSESTGATFVIKPDASGTGYEITSTKDSKEITFYPKHKDGRTHYRKELGIDK